MTETEKFFESRAARADFDAFDRIMSRKGGEAPKDDDRLDSPITTTDAPTAPSIR